MTVPEDLQEPARQFVGELRSGDPISLVLPAGCGKTEIISASADALSDGRLPTLILTHTNAGVDSVRRRLRRHGVRADSVAVRTVDGMCLRLTSAFGTLYAPLGIELNESSQDYWRHLRVAAVRILETPNVQQILERSYGALLVDEYQDCTIVQHQLISAMSRSIPTAVIGDPLQAIFDFDDPLVDWDLDVSSSFAQVSDVFDERPHRWTGSNAALGEWLHGEARAALEHNRPLALTDAPVVWHQASDQAARRACYGAANTERSTVALVGETWKAPVLAKQLRGLYGVMEQLEGRLVASTCSSIDTASSAGSRVAAVVSFAADCRTAISTILGSSKRALLEQVQAGEPLRFQAGSKSSNLKAAVNAAVAADTASAVVALLRAIESEAESALYRREAWRDFRIVVDMLVREEAACYADAFAKVKDARRHAGRRPELRSVSTTLLVKGLEFDRVLVLDANEYNRRNLYVAITRARSDLQIVSDTNVLTPAAS